MFRSGDEINDIASNISKTIHSGKQGKHIRGHNNFEEGKSELTPGAAQRLLDNLHGGNVRRADQINDIKTRVDFGKKIGTYVDPETGKSVETTVGIMHSSKKGAHIVPARPKNIDELSNE